MNTTRRAAIVLTSVCAMLLGGCAQSGRRPDRGIAAVARVHDPKSFMRDRSGYALLVGVSEYADPSIPDLNFAHRDALAWRDFLVSAQGGAFLPQNVRCLTNESATRNAVISAISGFLNSARPEDLVIVFFAGHGTPEHGKKTIPYLLCHDSRRDEYAATAIEMTELRRKLENYLNSQRVIVIADACHSAGTEGWQQGVREASGDVSYYWKKLASSECGRSTVTASRVGELSREDKKWGGGHGVFSHYMLEALKGRANDDGRTADRSGDGFITLSEALDWTRPLVESETSYAQHPFGSAYVDDSIPLGVLDREVREELDKLAKKHKGVGGDGAGEKLVVNLPPAATAMPAAYSGKLTSEQQDFNFAAALYQRGQVNEAMRRFDDLEQKRAGAAGRSMVARLAHLLKAGEYASAESVALKIASWFPGTDEAKDAAGRITALDAAKVRAKYDQAVARANKAPDLPAAIQSLQGWMSEQQALPEPQRSPHVPDARAQIQAWREEIAQQRLARYKAAMVRGHERLKADDPAAAVQAFQQARLETDDTTEADQVLALAKAKIEDKRCRDAFEAASVNAGGANLLEDKLRAWQAYLRKEAASHLAAKGRERMEALKRDLRERFENDFAKETSAAEQARKEKRFADALLALVRARKHLADAGRWGFDIVPDGAKALDALDRRVQQEEKADRHERAWAAASNASAAELAGAKDEKAYDRAMAHLEKFQRREPDNPRLKDAGERVAELRAAQQAYVTAETGRLLGLARAGVGRIESMALRASRGERADADDESVAAVRNALTRVDELSPDSQSRSERAALASRLEEALKQFKPVLVVTAVGAQPPSAVSAAPGRNALQGVTKPGAAAESRPGGRSYRDLDAEVYVDGTKVGTTPLRYDGVAKGRTYEVSVAKPRWRAGSQRVRIDRGGEHAVEFVMEESKLPPGFDKAFILPTSDKDQHRNPVVTRGHDALGGDAMRKRPKGDRIVSPEAGTTRRPAGPTRSGVGCAPRTMICTWSSCSSPPASS